MVGPAITFASTGNVSQAGLAYFTNRAVKKETGMSTTEYVSTFLEEKTKKTKKNEKIYEELMILVQTNFEQTRKKLLLQNQSKITN
jgi:predicted neutral ceramidase superfamily lipid hydrolase